MLASLPQYPITDDANGGTGQVLDRVIEEAELLRLLPAPCPHRVTVRTNAPAQSKDQGKGMLWHRVDGVVANIADHDAARLARRNIDVIGARCSNGHQAKVFRRSDCFPAELYLVEHNDVGIYDPLSHLLGSGAPPRLDLMRKGRRPQHGLWRQRVPVKNDDLHAL